MDTPDLDRELVELLNTERQKAPYILESLEPERSALINIFYEKLFDVRSTTASINVLDIVSVSKPEDDNALTVEDQLDLAIRKEALKFRGLAAGEIRLSGEVVYIYDEDEGSGGDDEDDEYFPTVKLDPNSYLQGDIQTYRVLTPVDRKNNDGVSIETVETSKVVLPEIWIELINVVAYNDTGDEIDHRESVQVKFENENVKIDRIIRRFDTAETPQLSMKDVLAGDAFLETCRMVENDLNYNEYDENEIGEAKKDHRSHLSDSVISVPIDEELHITASNALLAEGGDLHLIEQPAFYDGPTILKVDSTWRVAHGFSLLQLDGTIKRAHVLPNDLQDIR